MPYFLVSDRAYAHPQLLIAGQRAIGLWLLSGSWCAGHDRRFNVPKRLPKMLGSSNRMAQRLVDVELWEVEDAGWRFVPDPRLWSFEGEPQEARRSVPTALRYAVLDRDGHACLMCGATDELQMDHVFPWSLGGLTTFDNLQTLCGPCNRSKGAKV